MVLKTASDRTGRFYYHGNKSLFGLFSPIKQVDLITGEELVESVHHFSFY